MMTGRSAVQGHLGLPKTLAQVLKKGGRGEEEKEKQVIRTFGQFPVKEKNVATRRTKTLVLASGEIGAREQRGQILGPERGETKQACVSFTSPKKQYSHLNKSLEHSLSLFP